MLGNSFTTIQCNPVLDKFINLEPKADITDNWVSGDDREYHEIQYLIKKCDQIRAREIEANVSSVVKIENNEECQERFRVILAELINNTHCDGTLLLKLSSLLSTKGKTRDLIKLIR